MVPRNTRLPLSLAALSAGRSLVITASCRLVPILEVLMLFFRCPRRALPFFSERSVTGSAAGPKHCVVVCVELVPALAAQAGRPSGLEIGAQSGSIASKLS